VRILRIKAAVFDFDGTLVPFKMDYVTLRQEIIHKIAETGLSGNFFDINDPIRITLKKASDLLNKKDMETLESEIEEIIDFYELEGAKNNAVITGVSEVLKTLKEMNLKLGIFTLNQIKIVEILLKKTNNLIEIFDAIVARNSVSDFYEKIIKVKYLRTCLEQLGVKGNESIVIGDHNIDIEAGNLMNAITVGVLTPRNEKELLKEEKYDYLINSLEEIPEIVQNVLEI
jgi:phosphoglycolate phosphatase-like HAD superfamily hydrolase